MATVKFEAKSPYLQPPRVLHDSDYICTRFFESIAPSLPGEKKPIINVALFGLGRAGAIHFGNLLSNRRCRVKYVVEENEKLAEERCSYYRLTPEETRRLTPRQASIIFDDPSVSAVVIATPSKTHGKLVTTALQSGKAVLCEKPLCLQLKDVEKCYDIAEKGKVPLLCAMNRRFDPSFAELKKKVHAGSVGQVHVCKSTSRDNTLPPLKYFEISGGFFHDCAVHDIDMICWVLGEFPDKVSAMAQAFIPEIKKMGDLDTGVITMHFPSGTIATVDASRNSCYGYDQRFEVFGPKGVLNVKNRQPNSVERSGPEEVSATPYFQDFVSRFHDSYRLELEHFFDLIQGTAEPLVTKEEVLRVTALCDAVDEAIKTESSVKVKY